MNRIKYASVMNEGCSHQHSQRRNWSQSAAESWTWAQAVLDHPAACTASANSLPWRGRQQTCSFLLNEIRPAAEADHLRGQGFWERREGGYIWMVPARPGVSQAKGVWSWSHVKWGGLLSLTSVSTGLHYYSLTNNHQDIQITLSLIRLSIFLLFTLSA